MIPKNELRIGNKILWYDSISEVTGVLKDCVEVADKFGGLAYPKYEDINPIPLDHEIIEKCGFEKARGQVTFWYYNTFSFRLLNNVLIYKIDSSFSTIEINSLHQLQNLYFAITGEELIVNLTIEAKEV